jgi:hypothetical protein
LRVLVVLFFCAGIAFLGLLAGGEHRLAVATRGEDPMAGYYGPDMPRYPGAEEAPVGRESSIGGTTIKMSYFMTEDEPAKVGRFYASFWRQRRFFVREDVTHVGGVVSAVDVANALIYQALLGVQGQRVEARGERRPRTLVFASQARGPLRALEGGAEAAPVPLYPESQTILALGTGEGDKRARLHLSVNDGGLEPNVAHYARELRALGYAPETTRQPDGIGAGSRVLLYRKEGSEVTVNLATLGGQRVRVHLTLVES